MRARATRRLLIATLVLGAALSASPNPGAAVGRPQATPPSSPPLEGRVRLGLFPNVTHAPALVGSAGGWFARALGPGATLDTFTFNAGTEAIEALFGRAIDMAFLGPNPAINGFAKSKGEALRIVAGTTSGGARLIVKPGIRSVADLRGRTLATPSLGNTQDVALRYWLASQGVRTTKEGGGDVTIIPQSNASALVLEGGGTVLVDEAQLWPDRGGRYVTTHLVVRTEFLRDHPELVRAVLVGLADAIDAIAADPAGAQTAVAGEIERITGKRPSDTVIAASFENLTFTLDPIATSLRGSAEHATAVGLLEPVDLTGIYDLQLLNQILAERGQAAVVGL
jgi:NitT/TauT family transport system substrate-binding protein